MEEKTLTLDQRKRIPLGKLLQFDDVDLVRAKVKEDGTINTFPLSTIPAQEKWLWDNPNAIASFKKGLKQKAKNDLGSFAKFAMD